MSSVDGQYMLKIIEELKTVTVLCAKTIIQNALIWSNLMFLKFTHFHSQITIQASQQNPGWESWCIIPLQISKKISRSSLNFVHLTKICISSSTSLKSHLEHSRMCAGVHWYLPTSTCKSGPQPGIRNRGCKIIGRGLRCQTYGSRIVPGKKYILSGGRHLIMWRSPLNYLGHLCKRMRIFQRFLIRTVTHSLGKR